MCPNSEQPLKINHFRAFWFLKSSLQLQETKPLRKDKGKEKSDTPSKTKEKKEEKKKE